MLPIFEMEDVPANFEEFSIDEVRARYLLWPLRAEKGRTDYKIVYGGSDIKFPGYTTHLDLGRKGKIYIKKGDGQ